MNTLIKLSKEAWQLIANIVIQIIQAIMNHDRDKKKDSHLWVMLLAQRLPARVRTIILQTLHPCYWPYYANPRLNTTPKENYSSVKRSCVTRWKTEFEKYEPAAIRLQATRQFLRVDTVSCGRTATSSNATHPNLNKYHGSQLSESTRETQPTTQPDVS